MPSPAGTIDAHAHIWNLESPWMAWLRDSTVPGYAPMKRDFAASDFFAATAGTSVEQVVLVQAGMDPVETEWLLQVGETEAGIAGVVGWVSLASAEVTEEQLAALAPRRKLVGVRHMDGWPPDGNVLKSDAGDPSVEVLVAHDLALDVLFEEPADLVNVVRLAERFADLRIVVDHLAIPRGAADDMFARWADGISALAPYENIAIKYSGWTTRLPEPASSAVAPYAEHVMEQFGATRVMYAGNWPICSVAGDYPAMLDESIAALARLDGDAIDAVRWGTARSFYRLARN